MSLDTTQEQQAEAIQQWLQRNGRRCVLGLLLFSGLYLAIQYWHAQQQQQVTAASLAFERLLTLQQQPTAAPADLDALAKHLMDTYPKTAYASLAALQRARLQVEHQTLDDAQTSLAWVIEHSKDKDLKAVARVRLARLQLASQHPKAARQTLAPLTHSPYQPLANALRAQTFLAEQQPNAAYAALKAALPHLPKPNAITTFFTLQAHDLSGQEKHR